uniref:KRAB domain-containing protein n=1 Tax=Zosterops lateralis melanops TaxID=1220523 RepID=A0A8D2PVL9_ZOSLA
RNPVDSQLVPVLFEDVAVRFSRQEWWDALTPGQRELYRDVVSDTYELLTSLGYPGPKPDILHRLERGEEPWICSSPGEQRHSHPVGWNPHPGWAQGSLLHPCRRGEVRIPGGDKDRALPSSPPAGESGFPAWLVTSAVFPPGHSGSWLEEPPSGWWPGASRCQGMETLCPGESCSVLPEELQPHPCATPRASPSTCPS